jgi:radical SAM superfamily enzyme YgiQ (UPF0313 family)
MRSIAGKFPIGLPNMKQRILLINPWIYDFAAFNLWACPLGLFKVTEYLSSLDVELFMIDCSDSLKKNGLGKGKYRSEQIPKPDLLKQVPRYYKRYGVSIDEFKARLKSLPAIDLVLMTSIMSYWYPGVQEAIRVVKEVKRSVPIVLGGIYPTLYPEHALLCSGADRIYTGPVNGRLLSMLESFGIPAVSERNPALRFKSSFHSSRGFSPLLTSEGCPFRCTYCASRLVSGEYRQKCIEDIVAEIKDQYERGVRDFVFYDEALLNNADRHIKPLIKAVIQHGLSARFHTPNGLHARFIDDELADLMKEAGFTTLRLSFETADRARQESTGGKVCTEDLVRSVRLLQNRGFTKDQIGVYLLYGLPGQGLDEVEESIALLQGLNVRIHLAELSPIRGTACWNDLVRSGTIPDDLDPILTNNTVFSFLYAGYDQARVNRMKIRVKDYNRT